MVRGADGDDGEILQVLEKPLKSLQAPKSSKINKEVIDKNTLKTLQTPKNLNTNTPLENDSMVVSGMLLGYFISAFFGNMAYMTYVFPVLFLGLLYKDIKKQ